MTQQPDGSAAEQAPVQVAPTAQRQAKAAALQPSQALVYDAHDYAPVSAEEDPHGHGTDCPCEPMCVCGSAAGAYIHSPEARNAGATVMVRAIAHSDSGLASEATSFANGGNGSAIIVPGRDTRIGTPAEFQEPDTVRGSVDEERPVTTETASATDDS